MEPKNILTYYRKSFQKFTKILPFLKGLQSLKTVEEVENFLCEKMFIEKYTFKIMVVFKDALPMLMEKSKNFPFNFEKYLEIFSHLLKFGDSVVEKEFIDVYKNGPLLANSVIIRNLLDHNSKLLLLKNLTPILNSKEISHELKRELICGKRIEKTSITSYHEKLEELHNSKDVLFCHKSDVIQNLREDFLEKYVKLHNIWLRKKYKEKEKSLVWTESTKRKLVQIASYIAHNEPVILQGGSGIGKTSLVCELERITGNTDMIKIHIDERIDSKDLLGTYICSDIPGEFSWLDGTLTKAVKEGRWLLVEDLDLANGDIISLLTSLVENKKLMVKNEWIDVQEGFQLFATIYDNRKNNSLQLTEKWNVIKFEELSNDEIVEIINAKYVTLNVYVDNILSTFFFCKKVTKGLTIRDLMKWCGRIELFKDLKFLNEIIFKEAVSVFFKNRMNDTKVMFDLGKIWNISKERIFYLSSHYKPQIMIQDNSVKIGRMKFISNKDITKDEKFAFTKQSLRLLELLSIAIQLNEPVLLIGETGTGKTTIVQFLANLLNKKLIVQNLNQQTDSSDFIGGYKPVDINLLGKKLYENFVKLFKASFSKSENKVFLNEISIKLINKDYRSLLQMMTVVCDKALDVFGTKRRKVNNSKSGKLREYWNKMKNQVEKFDNEIDLITKNFAFSFVEGTLVKALKKGDWILLDEINLASNETLERLSGLLEKDGSLFLTEKGETEAVKRNPNFKLFACMNPPTDVGKKDLPIGIKNKFTCLYIDELVDKEDLKTIAYNYLHDFVVDPPTDTIVDFYLEARGLAESELESGNNQKPKYTLRTLSRAIEYSTNVLKYYNNFERSLYEGMSMAFLTQLNSRSKKIVEKKIHKTFKYKDFFRNDLKECNYVRISDYYLKRGPLEICSELYDKEFILTNSMEKRVNELARILMNPDNCSILLEGPTSCGKTSVVKYLSNVTGNNFVRINNHETTDIQEYFGSYATNKEGKFVFKEGVLVEAVRKGHWIVLDELNLASTEILESLNRLLDDNRELFIPETQEVVKPHPNFKLFATQNPPGIYSGRKILSRAFKNRFIEIKIEEIPLEEISEILKKKYNIPPSFAVRFVNVMRDLQLNRQHSNIFAGKLGFITPRDLFKWANRCSVNCTLRDYFVQGYIILGERIRNEKEKATVCEVLLKQFKRGAEGKYYEIGNWEKISKTLEESAEFGNIVWTKSMKRLFFLINECLKHKEPILLVGETGCGKTTICQIFGYLLKRNLTILNCHQNTETSDFIGALRPIRHKNSIFLKLKEILANNSEIFEFEDEDGDVVFTEEDNVIGKIEKNLHKLNDENLKSQIEALLLDYKSLFKWYDGPLVSSMKKGNFFLIDEINLSDDAVIERLNSVLEIDSRDILLSEKGGAEKESILAKDSFRIFSTMNPGGDFGKKELSHSLRNRFTEIFVPKLDLEDLRLIISKRLKDNKYLEPMMSFVSITIKELNYSIRDVIFWVDFINLDHISFNNDYQKYLHGCDLIILEGIGIGRNNNYGRDEKEKFLQILKGTLPKNAKISLWEDFMESKIVFNDSTNRFGCSPLFIKRGMFEDKSQRSYVLDCDITKLNLLKLLRGSQMNKPILLEGSPGVGKTSLVETVGKLSGNKVIRINLSEQTDIIDLIGCDLPSEDGTFKWCDGIFLDGLKKGHWIILDELNLASQSVLEGLNSVLDYRSEIYIPELDKIFKCSKDFKIFACQNPYKQGSSRKGLPKSFLNRFIKIYVEEMRFRDYEFILNCLYSKKIPESFIKKMIEFNEMIKKEFMNKWEFNLRDIFRWCDLIIVHPQENPCTFIEHIYLGRMRNEIDKEYVLHCFESVWKESYNDKGNPPYVITKEWFKFGSVTYFPKGRKYENKTNLVILQSMLKPLEILTRNLNMNYLSIVTGKRNSGKSSIIEFLAAIAKKKLNKMVITSSTDTMDLLGNFEQVNLDYFKNTLMVLLKEQMDIILLSKIKENEKIVLYNDYFELSTCKGEIQTKLIQNMYSKMVHLIKDKIAKKKIEKKFRKLLNFEKLGTSGKFKWINSALIQAIKKGEWIVLDNVNFCNPTVLDRLNSLFEPNGKIVLNERGLLRNGKFKSISPSKGFRLFMIYNPDYGEISRAMKNRGVEIHVGDFSDQDRRLVLLNNNFYCEKILYNKSLIAKLPIHKKLQKDILLQNNILSQKDFEVKEEEEELNVFPSSFVLHHSFKMDIDPKFSSLIRDASLLIHHISKSSEEDVMYPALFYFLYMGNAYDMKDRLELISDDYKENDLYQVFQEYWNTNNVQKEFKQRSEVHRHFPIDLRMINEDNIDENTWKHCDLFSRMLEIMIKENREKILQKEKQIVKLFRNLNESENFNFTEFFNTINTLLKKKMNSLEKEEFHDMIDSKEELFDYLINGDMIDDFFVLHWKEFEKHWSKWMNLRRIQRVIKILYPNYDKKNILAKNFGKIKLFERKDLEKKLMELQMEEKEDYDFKKLILHSFCSLYSISDIKEERKFKEIINELIVLKKQFEKVKKRTNIEKGLFQLRTLLRNRTIDHVFENKIILKELSLLNGSMSKKECSSVQKFALKYGNEKHARLVFPLKVINNSSEEERKDLLFQFRFGVFQGIFDQKKLIIFNYENEELNSLISFIGEEIPMKMKNEKVKEIKKLVSFLDFNVVNKLKFGEVDKRNLLKIFNETLSFLNISSMEDVIINEHLDHFKTEFAKLFSYFSNPINSFEERSKIWILLSALRLNLIKPVSPIDPILEYKLRMTKLKSVINKLDHEISEFKKMEMFKTGNDSNFLIKERVEERERIFEKIGDIEEKLRGFNRTNESKEVYSQIYQNLNDFMSSIVDVSKIFGMFENPLNEHNLLMKVSSWESNCDMFLGKFFDFVGQNFYEDLLYPVISVIFELKYGVKQFTWCTQRKFNKSNDIKIGMNILIKRLLQFDLIDDGETRNNTDKFLQDHFDSAKSVAVILKLLKIELMRIELSSPFDQEAFHRFLNSFLKVIHRIHEFQKKKKEEEEKLFKRKVRTTIIETDEEIYEKELFKFFPNYEREFSEFTNKGGLDVEKKENVEEYLMDINIQEEEEEIIDRLFSILNRKKGNICDDNELRSICKIGLLSFDSLKELKSNSLFHKDYHYPKDLLSFRLRNILFTLEKDQNISEDIYKSVNVLEIRSIFDLLKQVLKKLKLLLIKYTDHPILQEMERLILKILSFSIYSPIIKILSGLEVLFEKLLLWDEYILSSERSIDTLKYFAQQLSKYVLKWRRIELKSFKDLLTKKKEMFEKSSSNDGWFNLVELFMNLKYEKKMNTEVISILDNFLLNSLFGNYEYRLRLVNVLLMYFKNDLNKKNLFIVMENVLAFYSQFENVIVNKVTEMKHPLVNDLNKFLRLLKWENLNIISIKQNLKKSKTKLSKLLVTFENKVLRKSVKSYLLSFYYQDENSFNLNKNLKFNFKEIGKQKFTKSKIIMRSNKIVKVNVIQGAFVKYIKGTFQDSFVMTCENISLFFEKFKEQKNKNLKRRQIMDILNDFKGFVHKGCSNFTSKSIVFSKMLSLSLYVSLGDKKKESNFNLDLFFKNLFLFQKFKGIQTLKGNNNIMFYKKQVYNFNIYADKMLYTILHNIIMMGKIRKDMDTINTFLENCHNIIHFTNNDEIKLFQQRRFKALLNSQNRFINNINFRMKRDGMFDKSTEFKFISINKDVENLFVVNHENFIQNNEIIEKKLTQLKMNSHISSFIEFKKDVKFFNNTTFEPRTINFDTLKEKIMLMIQSFNSTNQIFQSHEEEDDANDEEIIQKCSSYINGTFALMRSDSIASQIQQIITEMSSQSVLLKNGIYEFKEVIELLEESYEAMGVFLSILDHYNRSLNILLFKSLICFIDLIENEFFTDNEEEEMKQQSEEVDMDEGGDGFDDGEGVVNRDLNDIENEEQVLKDEKDLLENSDLKEPNNNEEEETLDPETDFFSKLTNPKKEEDDENENEDEDEDEDEDQDMGDIEDGDERELDKQLWGDEDDDDEEMDDSKGEKLQNDTQRINSDEMQAKENEDEDEEMDEKDNEKKDINENEKNEFQNKHQTKDIEYEDNEDDEDQMQQEEFVDDFYNKDDIEQDNEQDENEDEVEDIEMPDNLNLSDDDDDTMKDEGEEDNPENEENEELKDSNSLNQPDIPENDGIDTESFDDDKMKDEGEDEDEGKGENENEDEDEKKLDPLLHDNNDKDDEMKEKDSEFEEDIQYQDDLEETPFGTHMSGGNSKIQEDEDENKDEKMEEKDLNVGGEDESGKDINQTQFGQSKQDGNDLKQDENQSNVPQQMKLDLNPLKVLGDSLKEWKEKLKIIELELDNNENSFEENSNDSKSNNNDEYEFEKKGEEDEENSLQTLAPTIDQEILDKNPLLIHDEEEEEEEEEEENTMNELMKDENENEVDGKKGKEEIGSDGNKVKEHIHMDLKDEDINEEDLKVQQENFRLFLQKYQKDKSFSNEIYNNEDKNEHNENDLEDVIMIDNKEHINIITFNYIQQKKEYDGIVNRTNEFSQELCEQLRLVLEPTVINKMKGDFKTGKRLNLKKIIPYIASDFRKDKIWLRRVKPNNRDYNITICIDDSLSMKNVGPVALESTILICKSLTQLEVGKIAVLSFGEETKVIHPYDVPFTDDEGIKVISNFDFVQQQTKVFNLLGNLNNMWNGKNKTLYNNDQYNIAFIISDGQISNYKKCKNLISKLHKDRNILVFLLIDKYDDPIVEKKIVEFNDKKEMSICSVLSRFPFPFYIVVRNLKFLPVSIAGAMRQFFEKFQE